MKKQNQLKEIQKRLPDDIIIVDNTSYDEFTEDEFLGLLTWIDCFNNHYKTYGKSIEMQFYPHCAFVSTRFFIDFFFYNKLNKDENLKNSVCYNKYAIYIKPVKGKSKAQIRKAYVIAWNL